MFQQEQRLHHHAKFLLEILAAAMQDYKRAIIIGGNQTWGKGTVQNVFPLNMPSFIEMFILDNS